jgi:hypothetical protein
LEKEHARWLLERETLKDDPDTYLAYTEDAAVARSEGESMASFHYSRAMANQFLFAEGWDKYHDRFLHPDRSRGAQKSLCPLRFSKNPEYR